MEDKKVTGAFIVNLTKQLTSIKQIEGKITNEDIGNLLKLSYEGFYLNPASIGRVVGFK